MIRELVDFAGVGDAMVAKGGELLLLEVCDGVGYDIASHLAIEVNRGVGVILEVYLAQSLCCWVGHKR